jgi:hypothetical protein
LGYATFLPIPTQKDAQTGDVAYSPLRQSLRNRQLSKPDSRLVRAGLVRAGVAGLVWAGVCWAALAGLCWAGLRWATLGWAGLVWAGLA